MDDYKFIDTDYSVRLTFQNGHHIAYCEELDLMNFGESKRKAWNNLYASIQILFEHENKFWVGGLFKAKEKKFTTNNKQ